MLRPFEAAKALGISRRTLNEWARAGLVSHQVTPGGHRRYSREAIERLAARLWRFDG